MVDNDDYDTVKTNHCPVLVHSLLPLGVLQQQSTLLVVLVCFSKIHCLAIPNLLTMAFCGTEGNSTQQMWCVGITEPFVFFGFYFMRTR